MLIWMLPPDTENLIRINLSITHLMKIVRNSPWLWELLLKILELEERRLNMKTALLIFKRESLSGINKLSLAQGQFPLLKRHPCKMLTNLLISGNARVARILYSKIILRVAKTWNIPVSVDRSIPRQKISWRNMHQQLQVCQTCKLPTLKGWLIQCKIRT